MSNQHSGKQWRPYEEAKQWARTLQLTSSKALVAWGKKHEWPADIPKAPASTYKSKGWIDYKDFLGDSFVDGSKRAKVWASYEEAKQWARTLQLTNRMALLAWGKKHEWPADIPKNPDKGYKSKGWVDWKDFLGDGRGKQNKKPPAGKKKLKTKTPGKKKRKRKRGTATAARNPEARAAGGGTAKKARHQDDAAVDILMNLSHHSNLIRD
jgi:hypothetical protein